MYVESHNFDEHFDSLYILFTLFCPEQCSHIFGRYLPYFRYIFAVIHHNTFCQLYTCNLCYIFVVNIMLTWQYSALAYFVTNDIVRTLCSKNIVCSSALLGMYVRLAQVT